MDSVTSGSRPRSARISRDAAEESQDNQHRPRHTLSLQRRQTVDDAPLSREICWGEAGNPAFDVLHESLATRDSLRKCELLGKANALDPSEVVPGYRNVCKSRVCRFMNDG